MSLPPEWSNIPLTPFYSPESASVIIKRIQGSLIPLILPCEREARNLLPEAYQCSDMSVSSPLAIIPSFATSHKKNLSVIFFSVLWTNGTVPIIGTLK